MPDVGLARLIDQRTLARGTAYAGRGRVALLDDGTQPGAAHGEVEGSGGARYRTRVSYRVNRGRVTSFASSCTCPIGVSCKHAVAVLLTALDQPAAAEEPAESWPPPLLFNAHELLPSLMPRTASPVKGPIAAWETALAGLVETGQNDTADEPLALGFELLPAAPAGSRSRFRFPGRFFVRPLRLGTRGKWIRTGIAWSEFRYPSGFSTYRASHRDVLREVARLDGYKDYSDTWIDLLSGSDPGLWDLLDHAVAQGVELVILDRPQPIRLATARAGIDLSSSDDGLRLAASVRVDEEPVDNEHLLLVGNPAHGVVAWRGSGPGVPGDVTFARLDRTMDPALRTMVETAPLDVPAADQDRFVRDFLPVLARRHRVRALDSVVAVPEVVPPHLVLTVARVGADKLQLTWFWAYPSENGERRLGLTATSADRVDRDLLAEHRILIPVLPVLRGLPGLTVAGTIAPVATTAGRDTVTFANEVLPRLVDDPNISVEFAEALPHFREADEDPVIGLSGAPVEGGWDWFDLSVTISLGGVEIDFQQLFIALAGGEELMVLPDGRYFSLDIDALHHLRRLIEEARALVDRPGGLRISRFQADYWKELAQLGVADVQARSWWDRVGGWHDVPADVPAPEGLQATLRPYQLDGYRWLNVLRENGLGGILADDMGLGKTVETLAMICRAREQAPDAPPFLVVAPTSLLGNWAAEAARFTPDLEVRVITETEVRRGIPLTDIVVEADLVVTSYTLLRLEEHDYQSAGFSGVILDEAQAVKNHQAKAFAAIKKIPAPVKFAITGTPMENNLMELWALFALVAPGLFPNPARFNEYYRIPIEKGSNSELLVQLRRRVRPLMLRRTKENVALDLPPKQEQVLELELEAGHRKVYQRHLQRERQKVLGLLGDMEKNRFAIFRSLTLLRQASIDPYLIDPANAKIGSTKLNVLMDLLDDIVAEGHRTVIFSQFTSFLGRVRDRLDEAGVEYCYLDGRTRNRPKVLAEFRDGSAPVFLVSLKAGGVGLNLTQADYCILLDPWWNPATEAQAVDRTHRIGQTRKVMVYRLVAKGTIEEKVVALKESKARLFAGLMADSAEGLTGGAISAADIRALLS